LEALEHALSHGQRAQDERLRGQESLFAEADEKPAHPPIGSHEFEKNDLLRLEKETLGLYVSEHPLEAIREQLRRKTDASLAARRARAGIIKELAAVVRDFPGEAPVVLDLVTSEGARVFQFGADYRVRPEPDFFAEVKALLGEAAVA